MKQNNTVYMVTAVREVDDCQQGVEIAGIFDSEEKAYAAKAAVAEWCEENECDNYEIFVTATEVNALKWYEIDRRM